MNIVDYIIIGVFIIGMASGFRRGFLGSLVGIFGSLIGLVTAYKFYPQLTAWADQAFQASEKFGLFLREYLVLPQAVSRLKIALPTENLAGYLDRTDLPAAVKTQLGSYLQGLTDAVGQDAPALLGDMLHQFLATVIINALAFMILWFVVSSFIRLFAVLFSRLIEHSVFGSFDRLAGMLLGAALTALTLTIVLGLAAPLLNVANLAEPSFFSGILQTIGEARLVPYFIMLFSFFAERIAEMYFATI